jgi:hypothetical protein
MSIAGMLDFIMCQAERQIRVITINILIISDILSNVFMKNNINRFLNIEVYLDTGVLHKGLAMVISQADNSRY